MPYNKDNTQNKFIELIDLIARLRGPHGCPWDRTQQKTDIGRYLIEEAYEVLEALEGASPQNIREELGDLLFQIIFLARIAEEADEFDIADVLEEIIAKMIGRHPHVFGGTEVVNVADVRTNWERIKTEVEQKDRNKSVLCKDIPNSLSALARAQRVTTRAADAGFDWCDTTGVLNKVDEELAELRAALTLKNRERIQEEAGDLLLTMVNLCRFIDVDAEVALRSSLRKFIDRFSLVERELELSGKTIKSASLKEIDLIWEKVKRNDLLK